MYLLVLWTCKSCVFCILTCAWHYQYRIQIGFYVINDLQNNVEQCHRPIEAKFSDSCLRSWLINKTCWNYEHFWRKKARNKEHCQKWIANTCREFTQLKYSNLVCIKYLFNCSCCILLINFLRSALFFTFSRQKCIKLQQVVSNVLW